MKRCLLASIAVFFVVSILQFLYHGIFLADAYESTASVWRPQAESEPLMWLMFVGYLVFAPVFVLIYSKGYEADKPGLGQGLRFGLWVGLLMTVMPNLVWYVVLNIPFSLSVSWTVGETIIYVITGGVTGLIYKK